jgi:hypothetical protein
VFHIFIGWFILMLFVLISLCVFFPPQQKQFDFLAESPKVSCAGIYFFYSDTSFYADYMRMRMYHKALPTFTDNNNDVAPPVKMLIPFSRYDCEDYAHAVMCLSNLYGQKVEYFDTTWKNLNTGEVGRHIGFCFYADGKKVCDD